MFQSLSSIIITICRFNHRSQNLYLHVTSYFSVQIRKVPIVYTGCWNIHSLRKKITWNFAQQHNLLCFFTSRVFYCVFCTIVYDTISIEPCAMCALWLKLDTNFCVYIHTKRIGTRQKNRNQQTNNCQPLPRRVFSL